MTYPKRLVLVIMALGLLTAAYERINTPALMSEAAHAYLNSLDPQQRARAVFPFDDPERLNWRFIPAEDRKGVALREMTPAQKHLAQALLAAALSNQGIIKAKTIMSLDQVLKEIESKQAKQIFERDPEKYYVTIFGQPSEKGAWGFRFEGHHVATNFTIVDGKVASSPSFFGANPAEVREGPRAGLRALKREEDIARDLMNALSAEQRRTAIVNPVAPRDITTSNVRKVAIEGPPQGIPYAQLTPAQREILDALVAEYAENFPPLIAEARLAQYRRGQAQAHFAWMGGIGKGEGHYYLLRTPEFIIEYDNTQDNNNHIHSVWRDFNGDFGQDLLGGHYTIAH